MQTIGQAVAFFLEHGGYSYKPDVETADEGRARCAETNARAEAYAAANGWEFTWEDDWSVGDHFREYGEAYADGGPQTCEACVLRDADGTVLESLYCIDDASREYRRVIQAELASSALHAIESQLEADAGSAGDVPDVRH